MTDLIQWFQRIFIEPSAPFAGTTINLLKIIGFVIILGVSLTIARLLRRLLRRFFAWLTMAENTQERVLWLIFLVVLFLGVLIGLSTIGIDLTVLGEVLTYSIPIGQTRLSLAKLLWFLVVVVGATILSRYLRLVLRNQVLPPFHLPQNTQFLLLRLVHIAIVILGVFVGLNLTGLSLNSLVVVLGGLSIGLGFGLQNIASNLVSGMILIFEGPIRVGDQVTVGETFGTVSAINMRSTVVTTLDNISIIVPNSQFVSEAIINWTHNDEIVRIQIPVGVAYGSDTTLVKQALLEVAHDHPQIMKSDHPDTPAVRKPLVRFINFGDSSLDFQLLAWIASVQQQFDIISDLHFMIDRKFREYGIAIPFPQRDVHLYSESDAQPSLVAPSNVAAKGFSERSNRESSL